MTRVYLRDSKWNNDVVAATVLLTILRQTMHRRNGSSDFIVCNDFVIGVAINGTVSLHHYENCTNS